MRVRLTVGKQRELIYSVKNDRDFSWSELAAFLEVKNGALLEWKLENNLLPYEVYKKLDKNKDFRKFIIEKLNDSWGQQKGGRISTGRTKDIIRPERSEKLAEFFGIILGDGNIFVRKEYGIYQIRIAGNAKDELEYLDYIAKLARELFGIEPRIKRKGTPAEYVCLDSRKVVDFLLENGLAAGKKISNKVTIPDWIKKDENFLKSCIRGLLDTDGSVFRMSRRDSNLIRINFRNYNPILLEDVRVSLQRLGYNPSKIIKGTIINLSRQEEISKYLKAIGFNNQKHIQRYERFTSPVV